MIKPITLEGRETTLKSCPCCGKSFHEVSVRYQMPGGPIYEFLCLNPSCKNFGGPI